MQNARNDVRDEAQKPAARQGVPVGQNLKPEVNQAGDDESLLSAVSVVLVHSNCNHGQAEETINRVPKAFEPSDN